MNAHLGFDLKWLMGWAALAQQQFDDANTTSTPPCPLPRPSTWLITNPKSCWRTPVWPPSVPEPQQALDFLRKPKPSPNARLRPRPGRHPQPAHNSPATAATAPRPVGTPKPPATTPGVTGPPYAYQVALDEAEQLLGILLATAVPIQYSGFCWGRFPLPSG